MEYDTAKPGKKIAFRARFDMEDAVTNDEKPMRILMISAEGPPLLHAGALVHSAPSGQESAAAKGRDRAP